MWRTQSYHPRNETEFFDDVLKRIQHNATISADADALIAGACEAEPLIADLMQTPQDIRHHAEGPFVHAHVKSMLRTLYALRQDQFHLIDVEELRRLKGYEGEIEELEEILKENVALFEVFALLHDVAKAACVTFSAPEWSEGARLGFHAPLSYDFAADSIRREELRKAYVELFHEFAAEHPKESVQAIQKAFFETYHIEVHYPHHDTLIYTPVYQSLLDRFVVAHKLRGQDRNILEDLIAHHMDFGKDFESVNPSAIKKYLFLADKRGYDADDYVDLAQACLFLDMVAGSVVMKQDKQHHRIEHLIHALQSEHQYAPERRLQKEQQREERKHRERNLLFREVGLDGISLMDLFKMDPGPEFGALLKQLHQAIVGEAEMPVIPTKAKAELQRRLSAYYQHTFKTGI